MFQARLPYIFIGFSPIVPFFFSFSTALVDVIYVCEQHIVHHLAYLSEDVVIPSFILSILLPSFYATLPPHL